VCATVLREEKKEAAQKEESMDETELSPLSPEKSNQIRTKNRENSEKGNIEMVNLENESEELKEEEKESNFQAEEDYFSESDEDDNDFAINFSHR
jgi:hypothetical protein